MINKNNTYLIHKTLNKINLKYYDDNFLLSLVELCKYNLSFLPEHLKTYDLCLKSIQNIKCNIYYYNDQLKYIPEKFQTNELCINAIKNKCSIEYIINKTPELCLLAVENGQSLEHIPPNLITHDLCLLACKNNGYGFDYGRHSLFKYIPENILTYNLCLDIINCDCSRFYSVPYKYKTVELCLIILNSTEQYKRINNFLKIPDHIKPLCIHKLSTDDINYCISEIDRYNKY
jgi:hypothetical protein